MGNFAYGQDVVVYSNQPTRRWKIRRIKKAQEKKVLELYREKLGLWDEINNMEFIQLEKPVFDGYIRHFELTDAAKKDKNKAIYESILQKINVKQWSHNKQF